MTVVWALTGWACVALATSLVVGRMIRVRDERVRDGAPLTAALDVPVFSRPPALPPITGLSTSGPDDALDGSLDGPGLASASGLTALDAAPRPAALPEGGRSPRRPRSGAPS